MKRAEARPTPAGRVSQQAERNKQGGGAMEQKKEKKNLKVVWSSIDAKHCLHPFLVIEFTSVREYKKFWKDPFGYLANLAGKKIFYEVDGEKHCIEIPPYYDTYYYGRVNLFWYNKSVESYRRAYKRLVEEFAKELRDYYNSKRDLMLVAKDYANELLSNLPVLKI